jgi:DNA-binding NarL/FixJ family response regulator
MGRSGGLISRAGVDRHSTLGWNVSAGVENCSKVCRQDARRSATDPFALMPDADPIRIVIADDQPITRDGLTTILDAMDGVTVIGVACDGAEAIALTEREDADVVLMDLRMPKLDGIEATRRLAVSRPDIAVVVLTTYTDDESILDALTAGARGYLTKNATAEDIHRALQAAVAGQAVVDLEVQARLIDHATPSDQDVALAAGLLPDGLSAREGEVLALVAEGLSNAEIADRLFISRVTVKTHINQILRKTSCRDRPQAILYAIRHEIATPREP